MKKLFLLSIFAVFAIGSLNAQEVKFGAKAGVNIATISGDDVEDVKSKTSFHVGAVAEIIISDKFSVQPELLFSSQGAKADEGDGEWKLDYINIPIMAKIYVTESLSAEVGPQIGFLVSSELEEDGISEDTKEITSDIDFGLNFGLGYKLDNGLNFAARYNLGLSNIYDFEGSDEFKVHNGVFQISVGYFF